MFVNRAVLLAVLAGGFVLTSTWIIGEVLAEGLPVSKYSELPKPVANDLVKRGCRIVADIARHGGKNVISGEFSRPGQTDWAVLCRHDNGASLLVYRGGKAKNPAVLNTHSGGLGKDPEAARTIGVATPNQMSRYATRYAQAMKSETNVRFAHPGIEDATGMGSIVMYYRDGNWMTIAGAD
jgi:hypothetical protein